MSVIFGSYIMEAMNSSRNWLTSGHDLQSELRELFILNTVVKKWAPLVIAAFGIFGNTTCIFITMKKEYRHISTGWYMSALAVLDNIYLVNAVLYVLFVNNGLGATMKHIQMAGK
jgi:hypothetical protein